MMHFNKIKNGINNRFHKFISERIGFKTDRKIVVFESDDWGSIRMPSKEIYAKCLKAGYRVDKNLYERYDSLASESDLDLLFNLLIKYKDNFNNHPIITANSLVSNPDFEKIEEADLSTYYRESIIKTFSEYPKHSNCLNLWRQGESERVFNVQYHGNEHLDTNYFIESLRANQKDALFALKHRMPGIINKKTGINNYIRATFYRNLDENQNILQNLITGLDLFAEIHGYRAVSFIAPNYRWNPSYNKLLREHGVMYLQGRHLQLIPSLTGGNEGRIFNYTGKKNEFGQYYLARNCQFEPSLNPNNDNVSNCLMQINKAFSLKKPAIISTHRVNYVGYIVEDNRNENIKMLETLIKTILKKWPNAEFMTSTELGHYISENK